VIDVFGNLKVGACERVLPTSCFVPGMQAKFFLAKGTGGPTAA